MKTTFHDPHGNVLAAKLGWPNVPNKGPGPRLIGERCAWGRTSDEAGAPNHWAPVHQIKHRAEQRDTMIADIGQRVAAWKRSRRVPTAHLAPGDRSIALDDRRALRNKRKAARR